MGPQDSYVSLLKHLEKLAQDYLSQAWRTSSEDSVLFSLIKMHQNIYAKNTT